MFKGEVKQLVECCRLNEDDYRKMSSCPSKGAEEILDLISSLIWADYNSGGVVADSEDIELLSKNEVIDIYASALVSAKNLLINLKD